MKAWLVYTLIATSLWGLWGFVGKLSTRSVNAQTLVVLSSLGSIASLLMLIASFRRHLNFDWHDLNYYLALLSGALGSLGSLFFYIAISKGDASKIVPITATYSVIAALFSIAFLHERPDLRTVVGMLLAVCGVVLLSR